MRSAVCTVRETPHGVVTRESTGCRSRPRPVQRRGFGWIGLGRNRGRRWISEVAVSDTSSHYMLSMLLIASLAVDVLVPRYGQPAHLPSTVVSPTLTL